MGTVRPSPLNMEVDAKTAFAPSSGGKAEKPPSVIIIQQSDDTREKRG